MSGNDNVGSGLAVALRMLLALLYPWLSHLASVRQSGAWAAVALADILVLVLLEPLLRRRPWALLLTTASMLALVWLSRSPYALLPLLAPPVLFLGLVAWWFGRTLLLGRTPLIDRIVTGLNRQAGMPMTTELHAYTRRLTLLWSLLLAGLALFNLLLALCAVPGGVFHSLGHMPPVAVPHAWWSWFANVANYGLISAFMLVEYGFRHRRFPDRPYRNLWQFFCQMGQLGPAFWRDVMK